MRSEDAQPLLDDALTALAAQLGVDVTATGERLPSGSRSTLVRARIEGSAETVVVKVYASDAGESWVREAAALQFLTGRGTSAPRLVSVTDTPFTVVMEDVGRGPTLAAALLASDPVVAESRLVGWAEALADLHAQTWNDTDAFAEMLATLAGPFGVDLESGGRQLVEEGLNRLTSAAGALGVTVSADVHAEVRRAVAALRSGPTVLSPSDTCPDNNAQTPTGLRLLDFEGAGITNPAWDVAYLRVPWPTCWCSWRLPADVATRAEGAYRRRLGTTVVTRGFDIDWSAFDGAVERASCAWAVGSFGFFLDSSGSEEAPIQNRLRPAPPVRARVQNALKLVAATETPELAVTAALADRLLAAVRHAWGDVPLEHVPAFATP